MPVSATATATLGDYYLIDEMLITTPPLTTMIPVKGDSKINARTHEGGGAIVEKAPPGHGGRPCRRPQAGRSTVRYWAW